MMKKRDAFWVDVTAHHESCDPGELTDALGLTPWFSSRRGDVVGTLARNSTVWMAHFREGNGDREWAESLEDLLSYTESRKEYLGKFARSGGDIEVSINQAVGMQDGILFKLQLDSRVLKVCGENGISLRVQAWSAETE
jgi:hypothetical protein